MATLLVKHVYNLKHSGESAPRKGVQSFPILLFLPSGNLITFPTSVFSTSGRPRVISMKFCTNSSCQTKFRIFSCISRIFFRFVVCSKCVVDVCQVYTGSDAPVWRMEKAGWVSQWHLTACCAYIGVGLYPHNGLILPLLVF